jgi:antitoxin CptB
VTTGDDPRELDRLRWRCRRGMRELDQVLIGWLERRWPTASDAQRAVFLRLLECEDASLWHWLLGHEVPDDAELAALVAELARLPD